MKWRGSLWYYLDGSITLVNCFKNGLTTFKRNNKFFMLKFDNWHFLDPVTINKLLGFKELQRM
jgi:hypothetical protein